MTGNHVEPRSPAASVGGQATNPTGSLGERRAVRVDSDGMRVAVDFIGSATSELFGIRSLPAGEPIAAAVLCAPFGIEHVRNYRNQMQLAYRLARAGVSVQRFDYRGSGNSPGEPEAMTFDSMVQDAHLAAERLSASVTGPLAFIGIRLGGLVAAATAERYPGAPVALWEPVVDGSAYFRQLRPWATAEQATLGGSNHGSEDVDEAAVAPVDVFGYPLFPALEQSLERRSISSLGADHDVLLAQIGRRSELRDEYIGLKQRWDESSVALTIHIVQERTRWWIPGASVEEGEAIMLGHEPLIDYTVAWLVERVRSGSPGA
jgi:pimeloyl-ACP methyl ester carboxylesterase